jgi:hypothetical protein
MFPHKEQAIEEEIITAIVFIEICCSLPTHSCQDLDLE